MKEYQALVNEVESLVRIAVPPRQADVLLSRVKREIQKAYELGYQDGKGSQNLGKAEEVIVKSLITITNAYLLYYPAQVAYCWRYSDGSGRYASYDTFNSPDWSHPVPKLHTPFREDWLTQEGARYLEIPVQNVPAFLADLPGMNGSTPSRGI